MNVRLALLDLEPLKPRFVLIRIPPAGRPRPDPSRGDRPDADDGFGTGFFVTASGHVLTAAHNLTTQADPTSKALDWVWVMLYDPDPAKRDWTDARVVDVDADWLDRDHDAALLAVPDCRSSCFTLTDECRGGDDVAVVGFQADPALADPFVLRDFSCVVYENFAFVRFDPQGGGSEGALRLRHELYRAHGPSRQPRPEAGKSGGAVLALDCVGDPVLAVDKGLWPRNPPRAGALPREVLVTPVKLLQALLDRLPPPDRPALCACRRKGRPAPPPEPPPAHLPAVEAALWENLAAFVAVVDSLRPPNQLSEQERYHWRAIAEWLRTTLRADGPGRIDMIAAATVRLETAVTRIDASERGGLFESRVLDAVRRGLDGFERPPPSDTTADEHVPLDLRARGDATAQLVWGLLRTIERARDSLPAETGLASQARLAVEAELWALESTVSDETLDLPALDRHRVRLEHLRRHTSVLLRVLPLARCVLGCHAMRLRPGSVFQHARDDGGFGPEMVVIPPGTFMMGSPAAEAGRNDDEGPQHDVTIGGWLAAGRFPVTFEDYDAFAVATGRNLPGDEDWGRSNRPVIKVTYEDACAYVTWLAARTGRAYRLPSEAQWEYCARAGTSTAYWWGVEPSGNHANFDGSGSRWSRKGTSPVNEFQPNPFHLHDTLGNALEWTADPWHENYEGAPDDGSVWHADGDTSRRARRGGDWHGDQQDVRCAGRSGGGADGRFHDVGFRVVVCSSPIE